ncbi:MAG: hypothetical protein QM708_06610 [Propioniciclava sp.]|uniref:hypothetical protein n=1 Tax=Propioniciclava sp. TaxID=2038686 RepID=UPI0039E43B11
MTGLPAAMRADFWLGDPLPGRDGEQDVVRVPVTGAVEVINTGTAENFPITTIAYEAWARYPAGGIVCRALAAPVASPGGDCWGWWGAASPFRGDINYAPPLEPGGTAHASLRGDALTLDVPAASTAGLAEALRTPTAVVVLGERIEVLMDVDPFENVCAAVPYGAAPAASEVPGSPSPQPATERIIAASTSPMGCDDLPSYREGE